MTTACFDGETLAVSSLSSDGGQIQNEYSVLFSIGKGKNQCQAALCGIPSDNHAVAQWMEHMEDMEQPVVHDDFCGLVSMQGGLYEMTADLVLMHVTGRAAVGSGWQFAAAAMDFGCDAVSAIEYAAKRDTGTGGEVQSVRIVSLKAVKVES